MNSWFFAPLIRFGVTKLNIVDTRSHQFAWFLKKTNLRIFCPARLQDGTKIISLLGEKISDEIRYNGVYEPETVKVVSHFLKPGMTFVDVGAHIGQYTILASKAVGPGGRVLSIEADPENFSILQRNILLSSLCNVTAMNIAISDTTGSTELYLGDASNVGTNSLAIPFNSSGRSITVQTKTLDDVLKVQGITQVNLVKADIEGAEALLLKGGGSILESLNSPVWIMEMNGSQLDKQGSSIAEVVGILEKSGYSLYNIESKDKYTPEIDDPDFLNIVAVPKRIGIESVL